MGYINLDKEVYIKGTLDMSTLSINFNDSPVVKRSLNKMANDANLLEVRVRPLRYIRSDAQNRYYWGVCVVLVMQHLYKTTGHKYTREEVHQLNLKYIYGEHLVAKDIPDPINADEVITIFVEVRKTTRKMNTAEFANFIDELRAFWLHAGCDIPEPEKKNSNFLEDLNLDRKALTDD